MERTLPSTFTGCIKTTSVKLSSIDYADAPELDKPKTDSGTNVEVKDKSRVAVFSANGTTRFNMWRTLRLSSYATASCKNNGTYNNRHAGNGLAKR